MLYFAFFYFEVSGFIYSHWIIPWAKKRFSTKCTWTFVAIFVSFFVQQRQLSQSLGVFLCAFASDIFRLLRREENNNIWKIWINSLKITMFPTDWVWLLMCVLENKGAIGAYLSYVVSTNVCLTFRELMITLFLS